MSKFWNIKASLDNQSTELFVYGDISDSAYWDEVGAKEFVAKYREIIDNQEFARNEIGRLEQ